MTLAASGSPADGALQEKQDDLSDKRVAISTACREGDIEALIKLADSTGGLLDDEFRATACKLLVQLRRLKTETCIQGLCYLAVPTGMLRNWLVENGTISCSTQTRSRFKKMSIEHSSTTHPVS